MGTAHASPRGPVSGRVRSGTGRGGALTPELDFVGTADVQALLDILDWFWGRRHDPTHGHGPGPTGRLATLSQTNREDADRSPVSPSACNSPNGARSGPAQ